MTWEILYRGQSGTNGTWKVTARRGSQSIIVDRLTKAEADTFDADAAQANWDNGRVRPAAGKCSVSA